MTSNMSGVILLEDRGVVRISGPEAHDFLQGLISNDMKKVSVDRTIYAALLTPQGKFLFDFFISQQGDAFLIETQRQRLPDLLKRLKLYKLRADVVIEDASADHQVFAVIGEATNALAPKGATTPGLAWALAKGVAYIDPRLTAMGIRGIAERASFDQMRQDWNIEVVGMDTYTQHRLSLGIPEGGVDIVPEKAFLLESNFDEMAGVDHQKGCYIGQETTSRTKRRGSVRRRLLPVVFQGALPAPGTAITAGEAEIGTVMSGLGERALANIRLDRWQKAKDAGASIKAGDLPITIQVPDWIAVE